MKVLLLGIDALDSLLIDRFIDHLPNLSRLIDEGIRLPVRSTFPPDSDTAWATIYTGMNPAEHGVVRFIDPLEKSYQIQNVQVDNSTIRGRTFWEILGKAGYDAHAIFPHLCYPVWNTPGIMVARGTATADIQAHPEDIPRLYPHKPSLVGVRGFPNQSSKGFQQYIDKHKVQAFSDAEFALQIMDEFEWDFFFVYWSTLDAISHFFWGHYDEEDPAYTSDNSFESVIPAAYQWLDDIIGRFQARLDDCDTIMVLSDHGHGGRPSKLINVNEILRRAGLLNTIDLRKHPHVALLERGKRLAVQTVSRLGLAKAAGKALRLVPWAMSAYTRPPIIDWGSTVAYASDMSGIKAYTYGGIRINQDAFDQSEYEYVRDRIIDLMSQDCVSERGESIIEFIGRREDLYTGPHVSKYPDIILEFKYGFGLGWEVFVPFLTDAVSHNIVPGSHRGDTGVFIMKSPNKPGRYIMDLRDISALILDLFGVTRTNS